MYFGDGECLHLPGMANVWPGAEVDQWPAAIHSGLWSVDSLADDAALELVVLRIRSYTVFALSIST